MSNQWEAFNQTPDTPTNALAFKPYQPVSQANFASQFNQDNNAGFAEDLSKVYGADSLTNLSGSATTDYSSMFDGLSVPGMSNPVGGSIANVSDGPSLWQGAIGSKEFGPGWLSPVAGLAQAGMNFYMGNETLKQNQQALDSSNEQFDKQFDAQKGTTNTAIRDRGNSLYGARGNTGMTGEEYYNLNKI